MKQIESSSDGAAWVTKTELAQHLRCSTRYINVLMRRQVLPFLKTRGLLRFNAAECDRALEKFKSRSVTDSKSGKDSLRIVSSSPPDVPSSADGLVPPQMPGNSPDGKEKVNCLIFASVGEAQEFLTTLMHRHSNSCKVARMVVIVWEK